MCVDFSPRCLPLVRQRRRHGDVRARAAGGAALSLAARMPCARLHAPYVTCVPCRSCARDPIVTTDVGHHQMWVAHAFPFPAAASAS